MKYIRKEDGFAGQELYVLPPDVSRINSRSLLIRNLLVCDAGYFPNAAGHQKHRARGIDEGILLFCIGGRGFVRMDGQNTIFLTKDQAFFIPPGNPHIYGASDTEPWSLYWMHIKGDMLETLSSVLDGYKGIIPISRKTSLQAVSLFGMLLETMSEGYSPDILIKSGQLASALFSSVLYGNSAFHREINSSNLQRIDKILAKMQNALEQDRNLSLDDMAAYLNLSAAHFTEIFKKSKGFSPVDYYSRMKIQKACRLLELTDLEIHEIGEKCSYQDRYYFSRAFKKIMGCSPRAYRENLFREELGESNETENHQA